MLVWLVLKYSKLIEYSNVHSTIYYTNVISYLQTSLREPVISYIILSLKLGVKLLHLTGIKLREFNNLTDLCQEKEKLSLLHQDLLS